MAAKKMSVEVSAENATLTFQPVDSDGKPVEGVDPFTANVNDIPAEIQTRLMLHGAKQKLGDTYAGVSEAAAMITAIQASYDTLKAGEWSTRSGDGAGRITNLAKDVATALGVEVAEAAAMIADKSKDEKKAISAAPDVVVARAEREAAEKKAAAKAAKASAADATGGVADLLNG